MSILPQFMKERNNAILVKLNEHIASIHEGKKQCNSCDANFTRKDSLVRHVATVHEGKKQYN